MMDSPTMGSICSSRSADMVGVRALGNLWLVMLGKLWVQLVAMVSVGGCEWGT